LWAVNKLVVISVACCSLVAVVFSESLVALGPKKTLWKKHPARSMRRSSSTHRSAPWEALPEVWERLPLSCRTSTVGPLGGVEHEVDRIAHCSDPGRFESGHHQCKKHRQWSPWEAMLKIWEHPPSMQKTSMVGPLGGAIGDPGARTVNAKNTDSGPPRRRC
jgi:hypothetical protein